MDYELLQVSWLNKVKSPGRFDFVLVAMLNASGYSNGMR